MVHGKYVSVGINYDYRDFLREVEGPVLVIYGEDDFVPEVSNDIIRVKVPISKKNY